MLDRLDAVSERMRTALADVGTRYGRVESALTTVDSTTIDTQAALSEVENVDIAKAIVDLQAQEVAYQAALGATARVIQPSCWTSSGEHRGNPGTRRGAGPGEVRAPDEADDARTPRCPTPPPPTAAGAIPVLDMVSPMLGFPEHRRFALARLDEEGTVCDLRSLEDTDLRFVVVPPSLFFDDYTPEVADTVAESLRAESGDDLVALVVVTLGEASGDATANLLAPVLVNPATGSPPRSCSTTPTSPCALLLPAGAAAR